MLGAREADPVVGSGKFAGRTWSMICRSKEEGGQVTLLHIDERQGYPGEFVKFHYVQANGVVGGLWRGREH